MSEQSTPKTDDEILITQEEAMALFKKETFGMDHDGTSLDGNPIYQDIYQAFEEHTRELDSTDPKAREAAIKLARYVLFGIGEGP